MFHDDDTQDLRDGSEDAGGEESGGGGGEGQPSEVFGIADLVHYYHHFDASKPMAAIVVGINRGEDGEPESYTLNVFTSTGGSFPAFDMKRTPTGKTGHFFTRKP